MDASELEALSAVSHEMRASLSTVLGIALTLERAGSRLSEAERADLLGRLIGSARKLETLVNDLLDLDRLRRGVFTPARSPTNLPELVASAIDDSGVGDARHVEVEVEPLLVEVDPVQVDRILENLLSNAARHTPPGTPVWVRVRRDGDGVLFMVDDAGPGVDPARARDIFQPFQQADTHGSQHGVGVGLALVARFAELHGGRAWVQDREGGGASFRVWLPGPVKPA
jgi:two-component system, OmpR family, sensor histidine kinase KdpD